MNTWILIFDYCALMLKIVFCRSLLTKKYHKYSLSQQFKNKSCYLHTPLSCWTAPFQLADLRNILSTQSQKCMPLQNKIKISNQRIAVFPDVKI